MCVQNDMITKCYEFYQGSSFQQTAAAELDNLDSESTESFLELLTGDTKRTRTKTKTTRAKTKRTRAKGTSQEFNPGIANYLLPQCIPLVIWYLALSHH